MKKALREVVIAGNWKMNKTVSEAVTLIAELKKTVVPSGCEVVICVPFTDIAAAVAICADTELKVGAQNCHYEEKGAFTGEISAAMLAEAGVSYCIVGHSERRQYFGETDSTVNLRARAVIAKGIKAIVCVGETLGEREDGQTDEVVGRQLRAALLDMTEIDLKQLIVAYEPVWAIGTGKTATNEQAAEVCGYIRGVLATLYGKETAAGLTVQYGGSMNPGNAKGLLACEDIDGGLVGGASLNAADFSAIVDAANG